MIPDHRMGDLLVFKSKRRISQIVNEAEARHQKRQSDGITASFYEACRIGNLDAASQLAQALQAEVARSTPPAGADGREDGDDLAAVRARLSLELARKEQEHAAGPTPAVS